MRILLVEDNIRLSELVAEGLSQAGMGVDCFETASNGAAALATIRYDAAVLDLGLPDGDGIQLNVGNVSFDSIAREMRIGDRMVRISRRELDLLEHLMRRAGRVVSRPWLEDALYGMEDVTSSNGLELAVHRLRRRLQNEGANVQIHTLRGVGYMMQE